MKQKIVLQVDGMRCEKCRKKAKQIAATAEGVISMAIEGADRNQVVVVGEGIDSATLTTNLRKKVGYTKILSVTEVKTEEAKKKEEEATKKKKEEEEKKKKSEENNKIRPSQSSSYNYNYNYAPCPPPPGGYDMICYGWPSNQW